MGEKVYEIVVQLPESRLVVNVMDISWIASPELNKYVLMMRQQSVHQPLITGTDLEVLIAHMEAMGLFKALKAPEKAAVIA